MDENLIITALAHHDVMLGRVSALTLEEATSAIRRWKQVLEIPGLPVVDGLPPRLADRTREKIVATIEELGEGAAIVLYRGAALELIEAFVFNPM